MLHDETRKLLIETWNKTHNAKEIAECFSVNTSTVITLGSDSYPPYNYLNEDGVPTGIDVELATEAFITVQCPAVRYPPPGFYTSYCLFQHLIYR